MAALYRVQPRESLRSLGKWTMKEQVHDCPIQKVLGEELTLGGPDWLNRPTLGYQREKQTTFLVGESSMFTSLTLAILVKKGRTNSIKGHVLFFPTLWGLILVAAVQHIRKAMQSPIERTYPIFLQFRATMHTHIGT